MLCFAQGLLIRIRWGVATAALVLVVGGCETPPPQPTDPIDALRQKADGIDGRRDRFVVEIGEERIGDADSSYRAYFETADTQRQLRLIEESMSQGEYGAAEVRYYFDSGRLFHYREDRQVRLRNPGGEALERPEAVSLYFGTDGAVLHQEKTIDGAGVPVEPYEVTAARNHGALLRRLALGEEAPAVQAMEQPVLGIALDARSDGTVHGTFRVADGSIHMPAGGGMRLREAHIGNMVALTAHLCTVPGQEPRDGEWTVTWSYIAAGEGEAPSTFLGLLPISCRSAVALRDHFGATPPVTRTVVQDGAIVELRLPLLSLDEDAKVEGFQEFVHSLKAQCDGDLCPGDALPR